MPSTKRIKRLYKPALFIVCLMPFALLVARAFNVGGTLGANPIEQLLHELGSWGLKFLLITLMITPLRQLFHAGWLITFRRMLGLFGFFYVLLHFLTWLILDQNIYWP